MEDAIGTDLLRYKCPIIIREKPSFDKERLKVLSSHKCQSFNCGLVECGQTKISIKLADNTYEQPDKLEFEVEIDNTECTTDIGSISVTL